MYKLFEKTYGEENAKIIMTFIEENNQQQIDDLRSIFLTKEDKIDLQNQISALRLEFTEKLGNTEINLTRRLDSHFKWLVGIMLTIAGLCVALAKFL